jgi:spore coat protein H
MTRSLLPLPCRPAALVALLCCACSDDNDPRVIGASSASNDPGARAPGESEVQRPSGWSEATHESGVPSYAALFDGDRVRRVDIRIEPASFATMQTDLDALLAERPAPPMDPFCSEAASAVPCPLPEFFGGGEGTCGQFGPNWVCLPNGGPPGPGGGGALPTPIDGDAGAAAADAGGPIAAAPDAGAFVPPGAGATPPPGAGGPPPGGPPGDGGPLNLLSRDPVYVPVDVQYDGVTWTAVGMRYKGNSSLAASGGSGKLPFRLNFDHYEVEHPEIDDQRFYGFKEMTFSSNWNDNSQLRELFANEVLRDRGIVAARAAFVRVYVDVGDGPEYWGLYTMIEDPSDAMLDAQLGSSDGNLYKPDGPGADWTTFDVEGFAKKNNEDAADWSDIESAIAALHAPQTEPPAWRAALEAAFDVDGFLGWLAVNTVIVNWDTYGALAHNYYLYADPARNGQLRWIPWDHNLSMSEGGFFGTAQAATPEAELLHTNVGEQWPLISKLLADPIYAARYREGLLHASGGLFSPETGTARLRQLHALIEPFVTGADAERETHRTIASPEAFADSIEGPEGLAAHLQSRRDRVQSVLATP